MYAPVFLVTLAPRREGTGLAPHLLRYQTSAFEWSPFTCGLSLCRCTWASSSSRSLGSPCGGVLGWGRRLSGSGL